jgi:hypothetical protein
MGEWDYDGMIEYQQNIGAFYFVTFSLLAICLSLSFYFFFLLDKATGSADVPQVRDELEETRQ